MTGEIVEALRNGMFRIQLDNGHETLGYTAGKMRRFRIRMNPGDRVRIELSAYDLDRGRIVFKGDSAAFEVMYERHVTAAFSLAYRMVGSRNAAA